MYYHVFHSWHRTFEDLRLVLQNLYIRKQVMRFWQSWRQLSKRVRYRFRKPRNVPPQSATTYLLWKACVKQPALTHTPSPLRGREKKDATKMNFPSCSDDSWINTTVIFFPLPSSLIISFSADFFLYSTKRWSYGTLVPL